MSDPELRKAMNKLAEKLQTREVESGVLVNMLNQRKNRAVAWTQTSTAAGGESQRIELPKLDKTQAFQEFVRNHRKYAVVEANNATIREKIQQTKELGDAAQALKANIGNAKQELQQMADDGADDDALADLGVQIAQDTDRYMKMCADMRILKKEVRRMVRLPGARHDLLRTAVQIRAANGRCCASGRRAATEPRGGPPAGHPVGPMRTQGRLGTSELPAVGASQRVRRAEKGLG
jgi:hypothetical protein